MSVFDGLRVLDVASYVAGPAAATILGDFGAEVIKVEPPGQGDGYRKTSALPNLPKSEHNYAWDVVSRNKLGLALDLSKPAGKIVLERLVRNADVLITNYPVAVRAKLGLDAQALLKVNPRLIFASVSGYGETGPEAHRLGFDATAYFARSGLTDITRSHENAAPNAPAMAQGDHPTATTLFGAIVTALYKRERTGEGSIVSTSLLANGIWSNAAMVQAVLAGAEIRYRFPRDAPRSALSNFYRCADDRWLSIAMVSEEKLWPLMIDLMELPELGADPRYSTTAARRENSRTLTAKFDEIFVRHNAAEWQRRFEAGGFTVSVVARMADLANDEQAVHAGALVPAEGMGGTDRTVDSPFRIVGVKKVQPSGAHGVGQHSRNVLRKNGYTDDEIDALVTQGIVEQEQSPAPQKS